MRRRRSLDLQEVRKYFDGDDNFVDGHAVRGSGRSGHKERVRNTPDWVNNDVEVRELLLKVFPKLATDKRQRQRAGAWSALIYMYFRLGYTRLHVALVTKWSLPKVNSMIQHVRMAEKGLTTNHGKVRGVRPRGRPRKEKNGAPYLATFGS